MESIQVKIENNSNIPLPKYQSDHAVGFDLHAANDELITIQPGHSALIPTGLKLALPKGYEAQIRPRSGLALKKQISIVNTPGTVDPDYRGEVGVILINHGQKDFTVNFKDRIAQMIINKVTRAKFISVDKLDETARGEGGFGSTGKR